MGFDLGGGRFDVADWVDKTGEERPWSGQRSDGGAARGTAARGAARGASEERAEERVEERRRSGRRSGRGAVEESRPGQKNR